jgi:hypothetical protein
VSEFADFLERLLSGQSLVFAGRPLARRRDQGEALAVLQEAYARYALEVAGPPIPFQARIALHAAVLVWRACWLVECQQEIPRYHKHIVLERGPQSPSDHLSADLVLRFLPEVYRRAKGNVHANPLAEKLSQLLRQWPLSGVRAKLPEASVTDLEFGGHPGLLLLYAERLAQAPQLHWLPRGAGLEYVEWTFQERGVPIPVPMSTADDEEEPRDREEERDSE